MKLLLPFVNNNITFEKKKNVKDTIVYSNDGVSFQIMNLDIKKNSNVLCLHNNSTKKESQVYLLLII